MSRPLVQLTGIHLLPDQTEPSISEIADPSPPLFLADGTVQIYGTGLHYLEFADWAHVLWGRGVRKALTLLHPDGTPLAGLQCAWDLSVRTWFSREQSGVERVLYAGAMIPTEKRHHTRWPEDNWNRRVYAFKEIARDTWQRQAEPLFSDSVAERCAVSWIGHCYGHHFALDEAGTSWVFYERVTEESAGSPTRTEIFARRMLTPFQTADEELHILGVGNPPFPSTHRYHPSKEEPWGYLVEGPRPVRVELNGQSFFLLGFSSGDFPTDRYGMNVAWSQHITGPYTPLIVETPLGPDFLDLGAELRRTHNLSWGPARPAFFVDASGMWWVLFHAVRKDVLPHVDYSRWPDEPLHRFHRNVYLAPLHINFSPETGPQVSMGPLTPSASLA